MSVNVKHRVYVITCESFAFVNQRGLLSHDIEVKSDEFPAHPSSFDSERWRSAGGGR